MILFSQNELGNLKVSRKWVMLRAFGERLVTVDTRNELLTAQGYVRESLELVSYLIQNEYCKDMSTKSEVITSYGYPAGSAGSDYYNNCNADLQFISKTLIRYMQIINERLAKLNYYKGERGISARKTSLVSVLNVPLMQLAFTQGHTSQTTPTRGTALVNRIQPVPRVEDQLTIAPPNYNTDICPYNAQCASPKTTRTEAPKPIVTVQKPQLGSNKDLMIAGGVVLGALLISNI